MPANRRPVWCFALLAAGLSPALGQDADREEVRYTRPAGATAVTECTFRITRQGKGWTITSRTERGAVQMEVEARYDAEDRLTAARATLKTGAGVKTVTVQVKGGKATVRRAGQQPAELNVPRGTIVTSAPDWSDVFLLCRRYDPRGKGTQDYPALWIHPTEPPQRLTFSIEWQGADTIRHAGKAVKLSRYRIRIRNNNAYAAWADARGRLVRLIPLTGKGTAPGMTLEGYERSAAALRAAG